MRHAATTKRPIISWFELGSQMTRAHLLLLFVVLASAPRVSNASRDIIEISVEEVSELKSIAGAKQEIFKKASETASIQLIQQIIGNGKFVKNRELIQKKVIAESQKYILFMKGDQFQQGISRSSMSVQMKLSVKTLRQMLLAQGLLYEIEGPPKVVTLIFMEDRVSGDSYTWWADSEESKSSSLLKSIFENLQIEMRKSLKPKGFYAIKSGRASLGRSLPETLRSSDSPTEDLLMIGEYLKAQIVILGRVQFKKDVKRPDAFEIHLRASAMYTSNGRVIGEVIRVFESNPGPKSQVILSRTKEVFGAVAEDLTVQIHEAWKSGTFGSSVLRLAVGGRLNYPQVAVLKDELLGKVGQLKSLTERRFSRDSVEFEVDSGGSAEELARILKKSSFKPFRLVVKDWSSDVLRLKVEFN